MDVLKYPIILLALSFGLGIIIQDNFSFTNTTMLAFSSIVFLVFVLLFFWNRNKVTSFFGVISYLLFASMGAISLYLHQDFNSVNHYSTLEFQEKNDISGIIVEELKPNEFYTKFFLKIESFNHTKSNGKLLVYFSKKNQDTVAIGDKIRLKAELNPILKNYNPNTFNYANYLENKNVFHQVKCFENDYYIVGKEKNFNYYVNELRQKLVTSFEIHHFSTTTKSIVTALLLGQKQQIDSKTLADYKNAGVMHILAISGLHIGIIYAFLKLIFGFLDRFKHGKTTKLIVVIAILWLFALISGMSASITRAVLMFSLIALGSFLNRRNSIFNAVATSFLILLIYNPLFIFDVGFQLSYAAVIAIILCQPFFKKCSFSKNKIIVYATDLFLVSMAAQIGVLPFMLLYFKQFPTLFLLANLAVIPAATAILFLGIITLFFNFVYAPIALFLGKIIAYLVEIMNQYIHFLSGFENFIFKNIAFTPILTLGLYFIIIAFIYWLYKPKNLRFLYVLISIFLFQLLYFLTKSNLANQKELIVFNAKESVIALYDFNTITFYSNDSLIKKNSAIQEYQIGKFNPKSRFLALENLFFFNNKKILVVDENTIYNTSIKPDVVIIRQNAKINIERLIQTTKPLVIVADKSNSFTSIKRWKAACLQYKIPFHAIAEKGFYNLK